MRIQPRTNEDINEEWISDKTRYAVDGAGRAGASRGGRIESDRTSERVQQRQGAASAGPRPFGSPHPSFVPTSVPL
eukprot:5790007-Prymnesium_polylepis.1